MSNGSYDNLFVQDSLTVTGISSFVGPVIASEGFFTPAFEVTSGYDGFTGTYGQPTTTFYGPVDFSNATVTGLPAGSMGATGPQGPAGPAGFGIRAAATSDKNGIMSYNVGISSCIKDALQEGQYTYYFDAPIQGGYAVSAQVMFNNSNLHANVMEQTADYVTILVTKSGLGKAQNKDHSIIIVKWF